ncbi:MAG TPA: hypothetical protein VM074_08955 [Solimonas sp.]|nr:hypothetical protein [Solimonas sp.]
MTSDRLLFLVAAAFNFAVALALALPASPAWSLLGLAYPEQTLFLHLFLVIVVVFGGAYAWIALAPQGKRALILTAVVGKGAVLAVVLAHCLAGSLPWTVAGLAAGDGVFALLFLRAAARAA